MTDLDRISPGEPDPPGCVHMEGGALCADCWDAYLDDPLAWWEYGDHPRGIENWKALQEELAAVPTGEARPDDGLPY